MSADIKLSKSQIRKLIMSGGALGSILGRLLPKLIKPAILLGKNILALLGLSAAMSATDAPIQKKMYGSGTKALIISNKELNDIMDIIQSLENSDILLKGVSKTIKNDINKQKCGALGMLLGTLGASLLRNLLCSGSELFRAGSHNKYNCGQGMYRAGSKGQGMYRAGQGIKKDH